MPADPMKILIIAKLFFEFANCDQIKAFSCNSIFEKLNELDAECRIICPDLSVTAP